MGGDYTRFTFDPQDDHSGVLMQQGRVLLDADWNELVELLDRRFRAVTMDIIGRCVVPRDRPGVIPTGFQVLLNAGALTIGQGRAYVDGILVENHGKAPLEFDTALAEQRGTTPLAYAEQPYFPPTAMLATYGLVLPTDGRYLAYLDVWQRELTPTKDPDLVEVAVGVDTATRLQSAWQVKLHDITDSPGIVCTTPDDQIPGWVEKTRPSAGRLTTDVIPGALPSDPCAIATSGGYRGVENRLYRIEIHDGDAPGSATFKWSRNNAWVASAVTGIDATGTQITVARIGRDSTLRFRMGDWVEITDDAREFGGEPGEMRQIVADPDEVRQILTLSAPLTAGLFDANDADRHTRVILWDQKGIVRDAAGAQLENLDAAGSTGLITVPASSATEVVLEDGVKVSFDVAAAGGQFKVGDYWVFAARTADGSVEKLTNAPPRGIHHHYCRLAIVTFPDAEIDCRTFWPPDPPQVGGEGCDCAACVTADSHNSGAFTIQDGINQVRGVGGGKVCLGPGIYGLREPLVIADALSVHVVGRGISTILWHAGEDEAVRIRSAYDTGLEKMLIVSSGPGIVASSALSLRLQNLVIWSLGSGVVRAGVSLGSSCLNVDIEKCLIAETSWLRKREVGIAVAMAGIQWGVHLRDNLLIGVYGISNRTQALAMDAIADEKLAAYLALIGLEIRNNLILAPQRGINFSDYVFHLGDTRLADNSINLCKEAGVVATGLIFGAQLPGSRLDVEGNVVRLVGDGHGLVVSTDDTRVAFNDISTVPAIDPERLGTLEPAGDGFGAVILPWVGAGNGIVLAPSLLAAQVEDPESDVPYLRQGIERCQVIGNRITGLPGNGILFAPLSTVRSALVKQNMIDTVGGGGIIMAVGLGGQFLRARDALFVVYWGSTAHRLVIENNQLWGMAGRVQDSGTPAVGILVTNTRQADILNNSVHNVGLESTESLLQSGILAYDASVLRVSGNKVVAVGPVKPRGPSYGISVFGPFARVDVTDNVVARQAKDPEGGLDDDWQALRIEGDQPKPSADSEMALPRGASAIAARGNQLVALGRSPTVWILNDGACTFTDNHCLLRSKEDITIVGLITAGAVIATSNYLEGPGNREQETLRLEVPYKDGPCTVLGNITSGLITVNGNSLGAPWDALNVHEL